MSEKLPSVKTKHAIRHISASGFSGPQPTFVFGTTIYQTPELGNPIFKRHAPLIILGLL